MIPRSYSHPNIHPSVIIEGTDVEIACDVEIGPFCYIRGPITIGARTVISPHVVIGTDGEHRSAYSTGAIHIGENVKIREFCVVQRGITGDRETTIGDRVMLMDRVHVAHNCTIGDDVTISPGVVLGGHTRVHRGATIGISAMTHQHSTIGAYSMIGMGAVVTKDVPPFALVVGNPAGYVRDNTAGRERARGDGWHDHGREDELFDAFYEDVRRAVIKI